MHGLSRVFDASLKKLLVTGYPYSVHQENNVKIAMKNHNWRAQPATSNKMKSKIQNVKTCGRLGRRSPVTISSYIWATSWQNLILPYANNKGTDQPARISTFVLRCQDSIIPLVSISEISSLYLASLAAQAGLCLTWSQTPKTGFLVARLNLYHRLLYRTGIT